MKLVSWNVNGIRACINKGFYDTFRMLDADILAIQESKMQEGQLELMTPGYHQYMNSAVKKGYSGTMVFSKEKALDVTYGIGIEEHDQEGRVITLEYENFYFVNVYVPNSKRGLERLSYRMEWERDFARYLDDLKKKKPTIICGDFNVAHQEIDLKNPDTNHSSAGFTDQERDAFTHLLERGWIDTYRYLYPEKEESYSWWSYMFHSRDRNIGWRIDYFLVSSSLQDQIVEAKIYPEIMGSDHCPIGLEIRVEENA